jgi:hypothetical protein
MYHGEGPCKGWYGSAVTGILDDKNVNELSSTNESKSKATTLELLFLFNLSILLSFFFGIKIM